MTFTLSGSLGESETGGTTINIIPRTGGNRYAGNFFTGLLERPVLRQEQRDAPEQLPEPPRSRVRRQRLVRRPDCARPPVVLRRGAASGSRELSLSSAIRNLNEGVFGANYNGDPNNRLHPDDIYQNASMRLTVQATQRNKFNIFWDEQYTCENPCDGTSGGVSPEAPAQPAHPPAAPGATELDEPADEQDPARSRGLALRRASRRDRGIGRVDRLSVDSAHLRKRQHRDCWRPAPLAPRCTTGSINNALINNIDNIQSRASAVVRDRQPQRQARIPGQSTSRASERRAFNDLRLLYTYATPTLPTLCTTAACVTRNRQRRHELAARDRHQSRGWRRDPEWLLLQPDAADRNGDPSADQHDHRRTCPTARGAARSICRAIPAGLNDPINSRLLPIPTSFTQYIPSGSDEAVWFASFYLQDQWTLNRFTFSGALRYDNAQSKFGKTCVGPDVYKPDQRTA